MPCSGDIKAQRPIPLTTPVILRPLFYRSCSRSCFGQPFLLVAGGIDYGVRAICRSITFTPRRVGVCC